MIPLAAAEHQELAMEAGSSTSSSATYRPYKNTSNIWPKYVNQYVSTVNYVILGQILTICMASAVYRRIFDDLFVMTSAEQSIRRDVFALYSGENTSDVLL